VWVHATDFGRPAAEIGIDSSRSANSAGRRASRNGYAEFTRPDTEFGPAACLLLKSAFSPVAIPLSAAFVLCDLTLLAALLWNSRGCLAGATLTTAWGWMTATWLGWLVTAAAILIFRVRPEVQSQLLYGTAILGLCPGIAVLGAKRPGSGVWNLFILLPLLLVLGWPALTVWRWTGPKMLVVENPVLIGYLLVLVMGTGNYAGTRYAGAALLYAGSLLVLVAPATSLMRRSMTGNASMLTVATALLTLAALLAWRRSRQRDRRSTAEEQIWDDFRQSFGLVWGRRIEERLNAEAANEKWAAVVGPAGLEWTGEPDEAERARTMERFRHHLNWLLRRFVDPAWVERRGRGT
jgi:hypothetical protein